VIEPTLIISVVIIPLILACVLGLGVGWCVQRLARTAKKDTNERQRYGLLRFSVREMLVAFSAICLLAAWTASQTREWLSVQKVNQAAFLNRFKSSFSSGEVELMAEPLVEELQRARMREYGPTTFRPRETNEYRITAPIQTKDKTLWAVWAYTCNEGADDFIYQFGYAESQDRERLPNFPFPAKRYVEGTWNLVDGIPATAGASASVTSITSPVTAQQPIVLTASAPAGSVCELHLFPKDSLPTLPPKTADKSGRVTWQWNVAPEMAGCRISYELKCIQRRGAATFANSTRGNVQIVAARPAQ
jgi:hypothetical protein